MDWIFSFQINLLLSGFEKPNISRAHMYACTYNLIFDELRYVSTKTKFGHGGV